MARFARRGSERSEKRGKRLIDTRMERSIRRFTEMSANNLDDLPDLSGEDSPELKRLCEQSAREVKLVGCVSAAISLEMVAHMRQLEIKHRTLIAELERQGREIAELKGEANR
jgi:hypothetical protein